MYIKVDAYGARRPAGPSGSALVKATEDAAGLALWIGDHMRGITWRSADDTIDMTCRSLLKTVPECIEVWPSPNELINVAWELIAEGAPEA